MHIIDLTHILDANMPVYPGTAAPRMDIAMTVEKDGFQETRLDMWSHTGTHVDAPAHKMQGAAYLDELPISQFFGLAVKLDVRNFAGREIPLEFVSAFKEKLQTSEFLVLESGWDKKWGEDAYYRGFPTLSAEAAEYLTQFHLQGVGMDMLSADAVDSPSQSVHQILLGHGMILIENLCHLEDIAGDRFLLSVMPLKYAAADGSPVRAVAFQAPAGIYYPE